MSKLTVPAIADLFRFTPSDIIPISSYHGEHSLFCRDCYCSHTPAFRVLGRYMSQTNETIFADIIVSAEGHILRDDSH